MTTFQLVPIVLAALLMIPVFLMSRQRPDPTKQAVRSLARERDVAALAPRGASKSARRLRDLPDRPPQRDLGVVLGRLEPRGPVLRASWEDVGLCVMAPRSGKTTSIIVPAVLDAPGPVVCTSNKSDAWACTADLRAGSGRVWTFDPQNIATGEQTWWFDPLAGLDSVEAAERLAGMFVNLVEDERSRDVWGPSAREYLSGLLMAARCSGGTVLTAYSWLTDDRDPEPVRVLREAGLEALAESVRGIQSSPPETRGSVTFTARVAVRSLRDPAITKWVTPPAGGLPRFDPAAFVRSSDTLYLLSKDGGASAAPFVAAVTDATLRAAVQAAEGSGGRLDPPLVAALDEAANIVRISDLPALYSHLGSRGVVPLCVLQSYAQAVGVWGESGAKSLWSAATVKVIGSGIDDAAFAEDLSRLIGEHDVPQVSTSRSRNGTTRSTSTRRDRIMTAAQVRALPKGTALVLATGAKPALVRLLPWYAGPRAAAVQATSARATAEVATRAAARLGAAS
jgi:type IV secretory pathway TraG/TraD family ATPase VirD4